LKILDVFTRSVDSVQLSLFMHPDQTQNTLSGIQGQEATAVAVVYVTAPASCHLRHCPYHELTWNMFSYKACALGFLLAETRMHKPCWYLDC